MLIQIIVEIEEGDPNADPSHPMGITNEAYERLSGTTLAWLGEVQDVEKVDA